MIYANKLAYTYRSLGWNKGRQPALIWIKKFLIPSSPSQSHIKSFSSYSSPRKCIFFCARYILKMLIKTGQLSLFIGIWFVQLCGQLCSIFSCKNNCLIYELGNSVETHATPNGIFGFFIILEGVNLICRHPKMEGVWISNGKAL